MDLRITPAPLSGEMQSPPSKSVGHRALICAYLGGGEALNCGDSDDMAATRGCLSAMDKKEPLYANESGSTLRFMIPLALAVNGFCDISGSERLMQRPLEEYFKIFDAKNIKYKRVGRRITARGRLTGGKYSLRGDVSSQFITGLLLALPLTGEDCEIEITTPLESSAYVDITTDVMDKFGVKVIKTPTGFKIPGGQCYKSVKYTVQGDFSQAAFFLEMGKIKLTGLDGDSVQGDKAIIDIYRKMGMTIEEIGCGYVSDGKTTQNITVDVSQIPDTVPALSCLMAVTPGEGRIVNAARLRAKESDRLKALHDELTRLGADVTEGDDYLIIRGKEYLTGGVCSSHNDHRIAMALASITPHIKGELVIRGAECVKKSMPDFWQRFNALGGKTDELNMGK